jgi:hypothetical protein
MKSEMAVEQIFKIVMVHIQRCVFECGPLIWIKKMYEKCMENEKFARRLLEKNIL